MSPSYFSNAHGFHVERQTNITATNYNHHSSKATPLDRTCTTACQRLPTDRRRYVLLLFTPFQHPLFHTVTDPPTPVLCNNIAEEALYNSSERCDAPKVHPETRKAVQEDIVSWIKHGDEDVEPKKILWVSGAAGAGKTAIAGSIAEMCDDEGLLAGSFFFSSFSGSQKRRLKQYAVATLAYCLLQHDSLEALRTSILSVIERDPLIFRKTLKDQCKALLLRPFYNTLCRLDLSVLPKVIILDGLDEVEADDSRRLTSDEREARLKNEADQVEILEMLLRAAQDPKFPFRIIVFSRPERVISSFFGVAACHISRQIFLDDKYDPDSDIELFLQAKFTAIRRRYAIGETWPSGNAIRRLVADASGQFVYPATVIRFLESGTRPNPQSLLRTILETVHESLDALAPLDSLYTRILMSSPDPPLALRWICASDSPLCPPLWVGSPPSAQFIRQLCQDFEGQEEYLLENLASVVHKIPIDDDESYYEFYHKSILDFLRSPERCGPLLSGSYNASSTFFRERLYGVLRAHSTVVPLTGSEWSDFLPRFWVLILENCHSDFFQRHDLSSCDIHGWVRVITLAPDKKAAASEVVSYIFERVQHQACLQVHLSSGSFIGCLKVCRQWRSTILGECNRLGWKTPSYTDLLLYQMYCNHVVPLSFFGQFFRVPESRSALSDPPSLNTMERSVRSQADLEEHEASLAKMRAIYEALPNDWLHCFREIARYARSKEYAAKAQLRRVPPEIRREMLGLDAWLAEGCSEEKSNLEEANEVEAR